MKQDLTAKQAEVIVFLENFQKLNQMPPTRQEIANHFNWTSLNAVSEHLRALQKKGWIVIRSQKARGIFLN